MGTSTRGDVVGSQLPLETIAFLDNWRQELKEKHKLKNFPSRSMLAKALIITGLKHQGEALAEIKRELGIK